MSTGRGNAGCRSGPETRGSEGANDGFQPGCATTVIVVEDAHAPDALAQLVAVLARPHDVRGARAEDEPVLVELEHLGRAHRVAVVVGVLALGRALRARAPRAVLPEVVARLVVGRRRQVGERRARVDDRRADGGGERRPARSLCVLCLSLCVPVWLKFEL